MIDGIPSRVASSISTFAATVLPEPVLPNNATCFLRMDDGKSTSLSPDLSLPIYIYITVKICFLYLTHLLE